MGVEVRDVVVQSLAAQGDGRVNVAGREMFVAGVLPGETVRIRIAGDEAELCDVVVSSPERAVPICRHYDHCGGCRTQHMSPSLNAQWKTGVIRDAFRHRGLDVDVEPIRSIGLNARRRAVVAAKRTGNAIHLGYREAASHTVVDLSECPILDPAIVSALPGLRRLCAIFLEPEEGVRLHVLKTMHGLDVAAGTPERMLTAELRQQIASVSREIGLVRLRIGGEAAYQTATPMILIDGIPVEISAEAFLQATPEAEQILSGLVVSSLSRCRRVADLFCGIGTLALPLARTAHVLALDNDRRAIEALDKAARSSPGLKPVETLVRDLMSEPLSRGELKGFDAVVFDPPRAGAKAQAEAIARSQIPLVVAVSCNPATLARDVRILVDGGFSIERVVPIDQFLFSPHVEVVAVLSRKSVARRPRRRPI